jgi:branched-chain amino acid aminotransferase
MKRLLIWKLDAITKTCELVHFNEPVESLDEVSKRIPQGAYTTFRTFNHNQVIHLRDHFLRLEETVKLAKSTIFIDQVIIRDYLKRAIHQFGKGNLRVRITLDLEKNPGDIYFSIEGLTTPPLNSYKNGVSVVTTEMKRLNPKAKLSNFLIVSEAIRTSKINGVNEVLMVDEDGVILEGLSSNFFAILDGQIWTEDEKVLSSVHI